MPPLLRPRGPLCHYCNRRSNSRHGDSRDFQCDNCLAENFLDEHGELLDVPPERNSSSLREAQRFATPLPNHHENQAFPASNIFCSTCLKNQHLLTETLANYLPSADDPNYAYYEASYPAFRTNLEERYPPVCSGCEPGARRKLEQARYTAKSDHLRRVMECSRQRKIGHRWGWRFLVLTGGKVLFYISFMGQIVWHLVHIIESDGSTSRSTSATTHLQVATCLHRASRQGSMEQGCADGFASLAPLSMLCGLLASWWNPWWKCRLQGRQGRLKGLRQYYLVHAAVLLMRLGFWVWSQSSATVWSSGAGQKASHTLAMMMMIVFTIYNLTRVKFDTSPLISWQNSLPPLLSSRQHNSSSLHGVSDPSLLHQKYDQVITEAFPVRHLEPEPPRQVSQAATPAPDDDVDVMEWEPSSTFREKINAQLSFSAPNAGPSPFHGALPPKPTNRLLHPHPWLQAREKEAIGLPPGIFDRRDPLKTTAKPKALPPMANPKFFSAEDRDADTGLEGIFDTVFSIGDASVHSRDPGAQNSGGSQLKQNQKTIDPITRAMRTPWYYSVRPSAVHATKLAFFGLGLIVWYAAPKLQLDMAEVESFVLYLVAFVSLIGALLESRSLVILSDVGHFMPSVLIVLGSAFFAFKPRDRDDAEDRAGSDHLILILLSICSCWEILRLILWKRMYTIINHDTSDSQEDHSRHPCTAAPERQEAGKSFLQYGKPSETTWERLSPLDPCSLLHERQPQPQQRHPHNQTTSLRQLKETRFLRSRSDSADSSDSQSSNETNITALSADWRTPRFQRHLCGPAPARSPRINLQSLALNERTPTPRRAGQEAFGLRSRGMV